MGNVTCFDTWYHTCKVTEVWFSSTRLAHPAGWGGSNPDCMLLEDKWQSYQARNLTERDEGVGEQRERENECD